MTAFATRMRHHLAGSREHDLSYEDAWRRAERDVTPEVGDIGWTPEVMRFAKRAFRDGYLRTSVGSVGMLAERETAVLRGRAGDNIGPRPCGWGGERCTRPAGPYLCAEHGAVIDAIPHRCAYNGCRGSTREQYCARHEVVAESNLRGGQNRHAA